MGDLDMELTEIVSVAAILIATFAVMWHMKINSIRDELLEALRRNREEILENRKEILKNRDEIQSLDNRLVSVERGQARLEESNNRFNDRPSEAELEQARLEGANRILGDVISRQSRAHSEE